jgi:6-phosphogluconolactonase
MTSNHKNSFKKIKFKSAELAAFELSKEILKISLNTIEKKGYCNWAVAGGNSILRIYEVLEYSNIFKNNICENLRVTWVDERNVPHDHSDSNFGNSVRRFWKNHKVQKLIPVPYHKSVKRSTELFNKEIIANSIDKDKIDLMILGMGTDGHIASLFPFSDALKESNDIITSVKPVGIKHDRVTMTFPMINSSKNIFLYIYGEEKRTIFEKISNSSRVEKYPILGLKREDVVIYSD